MIRALRIFCLCAASGVIFFYTFVVTINSFDVLGQATTAVLLDRIFPIYYQVQLALFGLPWLLILWSQRQGRGRSGSLYSSISMDRHGRPGWGQFILITLLLLFVLYSLLVLLPRMDEIRQAMGVQFAPEGTPLREQWGSLHGVSMVLNLLTMAGAIVAAFWAILS